MTDVQNHWVRGERHFQQKGDRKWKRGAKGGQPEKEPGGRGGDGFASAGAGIAAGGGPLAVVGPEPAIVGSVRWGGTGVGAAGAVEELAGVSVACAPG